MVRSSLFPIFLLTAAILPSCRSKVENHIAVIAAGITNYKDFHGQFPPAILFNVDGRRAHSWRVLVTPFVEANSFYNQYDMNSLWNEGTNRDLSVRLGVQNDLKSHIYIRFSNHPQHLESQYVLVIDESVRMSSNNSSALFKEGIDGKVDGNVLLLELTASGIHWMEPRDYSYADFAHNSEIYNRVKSGVLINSDCKWRILEPTDVKSIIEAEIKLRGTK